SSAGRIFASAPFGSLFGTRTVIFGIKVTRLLDSESQCSFYDPRSLPRRLPPTSGTPPTAHDGRENSAAPSPRHLRAPQTVTADRAAAADGAGSRSKPAS